MRREGLETNFEESGNRRKIVKPLKVIVGHDRRSIWVLLICPTHQILASR